MVVASSIKGFLIPWEQHAAQRPGRNRPSGRDEAITPKVKRLFLQTVAMVERQARTVHDNDASKPGGCEG